MKEEKIENLIPELADEALEQAAGGGYFSDPMRRRCAKCPNALVTEEDLRTGLCKTCRDDGIIGGRPEP